MRTPFNLSPVWYLRLERVKKHVVLLFVSFLQPPLFPSKHFDQKIFSSFLRHFKKSMSLWKQSMKTIIWRSISNMSSNSLYNLKSFWLLTSGLHLQLGVGVEVGEFIHRLYKAMIISYSFIGLLRHHFKCEEQRTPHFISMWQWKLDVS